VAQALKEEGVAKFVIQPHGRLQEWIADEKGYFRDDGLDYEFQTGWAAKSRKMVDSSGAVNEIRAGAFEAYKHGGGNKGVKSDISCACHWTIGEAAARQIGTMWRDSYVVTPGAIMVPPESELRRPDDLAGREIAVGYHSGSHFTTIQSLEPFLSPKQISLKFVGSIWARVDAAIDRDVPATSVWGLTYQFLEQLGFRDCRYDFHDRIHVSSRRGYDRRAEIHECLAAGADGSRPGTRAIQTLLSQRNPGSVSVAGRRPAVFDGRAHRLLAI
jgi:hypothetical protein